MRRSTGHQALTPAWIGRLLCMLFVVAAVPYAGQAQELPLRYWALTDGGFRARMVERDGGTLRLLTESGERVTASYEQLSNEDKLYIDRLEDVDPCGRIAAPAWVEGYPVRYVVRVAGDLVNAPSPSVIARIPSGGWLAEHADDLLVQTASGVTLRPTLRSSGEHGDSLIQFPRTGPDRFYWVYAGGQALPASGAPSVPQGAPTPAAPHMQEGLLFEARHTNHTPADTWEGMLPTLAAPGGMVANGVTSNCYELHNPYASTRQHSYAVSFRGYIRIDTPGTYRFLLNGADATYLKIGDQVIQELTGRRPRVSRYHRNADVGYQAVLSAGLHPITTHHVVFDAAQAVNVSGLLWLRPGGSEWEIVPHKVFPRVMLAVPIQIESRPPGGRGYAVFDAAVADTLTSHGLKFNRVELRAHTPPADASAEPRPQALTWSLSDGSRKAGASVTWFPSDDGVYYATLHSDPALPGFTRRIVVNTRPEAPDPGALETLEEELASRDLSRMHAAGLGDIAAVLERIEDFAHPQIAVELETRLAAYVDIDPATKLTLFTHRLRTMAREGSSTAELEALFEECLRRLQSTPTLTDRLRRRFAQVLATELRDPTRGIQELTVSLENSRRARPDSAYHAALMIGDLYLMGLGDMRKAQAAYTLAGDLRHASSGQGTTLSTIHRGVLFRHAERVERDRNRPAAAFLIDQTRRTQPASLTDPPILLIRAGYESHTGNYSHALALCDRVLGAPQWPRYHAQARGARADALARAGDTAAAIEELETLCAEDRGYFEGHGLQAFLDHLRVRLHSLERAAGHCPQETSAPPSLSLMRGEGTVTFAPTETWLDLTHGGIRPRPSMGFEEGYTALGDIPVRLGAEPTRLPVVRFSGVPYGRPLRIDFWYREQMHPAHPDEVARLAIQVRDAGTGLAVATAEYTLEQTMGQWRKGGIELQTPDTLLDGTLHCELLYRRGLVEIDGLRISAPASRQRERLRRFIKPDFSW